MERKKILIAGRVNHNNYGDTLMVAIVAQYCIDLNYEVLVLDTGNFLVEQLSEIGLKITNVAFEELADYEVYKCIFTGGGYLAHNFFNGKKWCKKWISDAYFINASNYLIKNEIPYCFISVEVGPIYSDEMKRIVKKIFDNAEFVIVRNKESLSFVQSKVTDSANIVHSQDLVLTELLPIVEKMKLSGVLQDKFSNDGAITLGVHVTDKFDCSNFFKRRFVTDLIKVVNSNDGIKNVVIFSDNEETTNLDGAFDILSAGINRDKTIVRFKSLTDVLCAINESSHIITTKLHVGVSAISMGKKVLCLSDTPKSRRFYASIGQLPSHDYFYLRSFFNNKDVLNGFINSTDEKDSLGISYGSYKTTVEEFLCERS
ncbi:polysaccharide pyruvyl transferase family protein [Rheinheimera marina]|uniref:Polysaccharide pyruvyl transferase family protein n=1 Tax=Rheinheimera marina TaxID=1774958 RepID=A0ABV9JRA3_9GAMM